MPDRLISHRRIALCAAFAAAMLLATGCGARAAPAATLRQLRSRLEACARPLRAPREAVGSEVTVLFSVRRDGSLQGRPRITHAQLAGDGAAQRAFVAAALASVAACFPLPITDGLGGAIAGRPLRLRVGGRAPGRDAARSRLTARPGMADT